MNIEILRAVRYGALAAIAVFAFACIAFGLGAFQSNRTGLTPGGPAVAPFNLVDQTREPVSERDLKGKPAVVFFGFTFCPEVCPTTLASLTALMGRLGSEADRFNVFFISVDPERDKPEELKNYLSSFDPRIHGLTGAPEQIAKLAQSLGAFYKRVPIEGGGYTMDHTATVFLVDAEGRFAGTIAYGENKEVALSKLQRLANGS